MRKAQEKGHFLSVNLVPVPTSERIEFLVPSVLVFSWCPVSEHTMYESLHRKSRMEQLGKG